MNANGIYEKLTPIFRDVFDDDNLVPNDDMVAADVADWDSLAHIRLIVAVEEAFDVRFSAAEASSLENVGHLVSCILGRLPT